MIQTIENEHFAVEVDAVEGGSLPGRDCAQSAYCSVGRRMRPHSVVRQSRLSCIKISKSLMIINKLCCRFKWPAHTVGTGTC